jgi:hypothetical protein
VSVSTTLVTGLLADGLASNIIWLADTNYRIDLDNDTVRSMVQSGDLDSLVAADQVSRNVVL